MASPYGYRGYYQDSETGFYYLNARYYDPSTQQFTQEDTYWGNINDPMSLNLYGYCADNPVKFSDPSGHMYAYDPDHPDYGPRDAEIIAFMNAHGDGSNSYDIYEDLKDNPNWIPAKNIFFVYDYPGHDFKEQAKWMANYAYKNKDIKYIYLSTPDQFIEEWNNLSGDINDIHLFLHGAPGILWFIDSSLSLDQLHELQKKKISGMAYLFSCYGGTAVNNLSVAGVFSSRLYGSRVRACVGGSVIYRDWYQLFKRRPLTKIKGAYWADFYESERGGLQITKIGRKWRL